MQRGASLGDILLEKGFIKQAQLDDAKRWQKTHPNEKISAILLSRGIITEDAMLSAMAERFNTTYINTELVVRRPEILKNVPEQIVKKHCIMPLDVKGGADNNRHARSARHRRVRGRKDGHAYGRRFCPCAAAYHRKRD